MNEEKARGLLDGIIGVYDDGLYGRGLEWRNEKGDNHYVMFTEDCDFGIEELEAIVWWMRNKKK